MPLSRGQKRSQIIGKRVKVNIKERDKRIFCYLFEQKVASLKTLRERFFPGTTKSAAVQRLQKLLRAELIGKEAYSSKSNRWKTYYYLTAKGFAVIGQSFDLNSSSASLASDSVMHDLTLAEIRLRLESRSMVDGYYTENYLKNCQLGNSLKKLAPLRELNSDAAIIVKTKHGQFNAAIEYERSRKKPIRYDKKLLEYYLRPDITAVFYICETDAIAKSIVQADQETRHDLKAKVYTILREKVTGVESKLPFRNSDGGTFVLE